MLCLNKVAIKLLSLSLLICLVSSIAAAQTVDVCEPTGFKYVEETVFVKEPVKVSKWVEETVYEKQQKKTFKHVWNTEKREKRTTVKKPVQKTTLKEERRIVRKPITETKYREKRVEETTYETINEMREEEYTVRKPVIETEMREENVTVRRKVTENLIEVKNVTTYRPVAVPETRMVPIAVPVEQCIEVPDSSQRSRLQWLRPGYYSDPTTGQSVYRRPGLHWVQPTTGVSVASTVPSLVPQTTQRTTYVPETIERRRPVEISRYVDRVETRRVPVEVQRMVEEIVTRRVPYTVRKPVTKVIVEQVPYTETRYVEEVVLTKVPVVETVYEEVTQVEPYEIEVSRWVPVTEEIEVPKTVCRKVEYEEVREVAKTILMKVPVDADGNPTGPGVRVTEEDSGSSSRYSSGYGSTEESGTTRYQGTWQNSPTKTLNETAETAQPRSIMVPESEEPSAKNPVTNLSPLQGGGLPADQPPALESNDQANLGAQGQDISDIANLEVRQKPAAEGSGTKVPVADGSSLPSANRPEVQPTQTGDEFAAERNQGL